jgi:hypothetical protein
VKLSSRDEEEFSCGESDFVHTDSSVVRQLQPAETEGVTCFGEEEHVFDFDFDVVVVVLFLVLVLFLDGVCGCVVFGEVKNLLVLLMLFWLSSLVK